MKSNVVIWNLLLISKMPNKIAKLGKSFLKIFLSGFLVLTFLLGIIATVSGFYAFFDYYSMIKSNLVIYE